MSFILIGYGGSGGLSNLGVHNTAISQKNKKGIFSLFAGDKLSSYVILY